MSFFSKMMTRGSAALAAFTTEDKAALQSDAATTGTLAMMALVAGADGVIEPEEQKAILGYMRSSDLFAGKDREALAAKLTGYFAKAKDNFVREDLFDLVAKLQGTPSAPALMRIGLHVAGADGEVEPAEKEVLRQACASLGLNPADYPKLAA